MAKTGPKQGTKNFSQKGFTKNLLSIMKNREQAVECCTAPAQSADIFIFGSPTQAGTFMWNKPANAKMILVQMFAGGASGAGSIFAGASPGGAGGGYGEAWLPGSMVPDTVLITVGAGGIGPTGSSSVSGGNSAFGNFIFVRGGSGTGGGAGQPYSVATQNLFFNGGTGIITNGGNGVYTPRGGCAGAGGAATAFVNGGTGGFNTNTTPTTPSNAIPGWVVGNAGGIGGVYVSSGTNGASGQNGQSSLPGSIIAGGGGGGGTAGFNGNGGNGGNGGWPGAGGGGAGFTSAQSGPQTVGGNGANGEVIITVLY